MSCGIMHLNYLTAQSLFAWGKRFAQVFSFSFLLPFLSSIFKVTETCPSFLVIKIAVFACFCSQLLQLFISRCIAPTYTDRHTLPKVLPDEACKPQRIGHLQATQIHVAKAAKMQKSMQASLILHKSSQQVCLQYIILSTTVEFY